jgi:cytochrome c5
VLQTGEAIYTSTCAACHGSGAAGAPKFGDAGAWGARIAQGFDTLVKHANEGLRAMPAKGGNPELADVKSPAPWSTWPTLQAASSKNRKHQLRPKPNKRS